MSDKEHPLAGTELSLRTSNLVGLYSSVLTAIITLVTFSFAITAIPSPARTAVKDALRIPI